MLGFVVLTLVTVAQVQAAPAFCGGKDSKYRITLSNDHKSANVTVDGEEVMFGHLVCRPLRNEGIVGEAFLRCQSPHVADAGYVATFYRSNEHLRSTVKLGEFWIGGTHDRGTYTCIHALNSME